jgi:diguanylate cyclase (GGDEF)-like protein/PAS domain S-box-containing protein
VKLPGIVRRLLGRVLGRSRADKGIGRTSATVLALAVLCTGVASYSYLRDSMVRDRTAILEAELELRSQQVILAIRARVQMAAALMARGPLAHAISVYQSESANVVERTNALMTLQLTAGNLVNGGDLRAVEFRSLEGDRIASAASLPQLPSLSVPLLRAGDTLYWDGGLVLRLLVDIPGEDGSIGTMLGEMRVTEADAAISGTHHLGKTGEAGLCGMDGLRRVCFPSRFQPAGSVDTLHVPAILSVDRALGGQSGTLRLADYRNHRSYSTFQRLEELGLALVVKIDEAELLAPIRRQLMLGLPALVLLALAGAILIGRQLKPLTAELVSARLRADSEVASRTVAEAEIRLAKRQLQLVADNAPFLIAFLDTNFIFRFANRAHAQWFQRSLDQIIGLPMDALVGEVMAVEYRQAMMAAAAEGKPQSVFRERLREGESKFVELTFVAQFDEGGRLEGYCVTARDATQNVLREQTLLLAARRDPLTGLSNRTSFNEQLELALRPGEIDPCLLTVAYLDIDHFKKVNDRFGHAVGDQLLKEVARRITQALRPADVIARLGGDEIALIMPLATTDDLHAIGLRLLESIREPFLIEGHVINASASIGVAVARPGDTSATLLKRADMALYEAKASGRNGMFHADEGLIAGPPASRLATDAAVES